MLDKRPPEERGVFQAPGTAARLGIPQRRLRGTGAAVQCAGVDAAKPSCIQEMQREVDLDRSHEH